MTKMIHVVSNCLLLGDRICDTPPNPHVTGNLTSAEVVFNNDMFDDANCEMDNDGMITDFCGNLFTDTNEVIGNNVMSYLCNDQAGVPRLTDGQNLMIRTKMDNGDGTFKWEHDQNEMPFTQGLTVNNTMVKNSNEAFNGDIVINSNLTIENCIIELTEGHKIVVNDGATLTLDNATIRTYTGGICYFPMEGKTKWEGIEINPSVAQSTEFLVYDGTLIDDSESGVYSIDNFPNDMINKNLLNITFNNSTIKGPAFDIEKTIGLQQLLKSTFDHTVNVTNNFHLNVHGCTFNFASGSQESGIKAFDTNLQIEKAYGGVLTTFTNCGNGVEFISSTAQTCRILGSKFNKVLSGINATSMAGFLNIHDCEIELRDPTGTQNFKKGIRVDNFIDFEIYDNNDIKGSGDISQVGIEIINMAENDNPNIIVNNTISNCNQGIITNLAELGNEMSGVEFECNTFVNITKDNFRTGRIGPHQGRGMSLDGSPGRPAGNVFDGNTESFEDFNYQGGGFGDQFIKTYHFRNAGNEKIEDYNDGSTSQTPAIFFINQVAQSGNQTQCTYPEVYSGPNPFPGLRDGMIPMFDGGDTDGSINIVKTNSSTNTNYVLTEILGDSPWVSVPVVQTLMTYSQYYTEAQIVQVLLQNPGVLCDTYLGNLAFESGSFSSANQQLMIQAIRNGDARMDYENGLVDDIREGTSHIKNILNSEASNQTYNQATIRSAISGKISYSKLYQTVESYLLEHDYVGAQNELNEKADFENFDPHLLSEKAKYTEIILMESNLSAQGKHWSEVSISDYNTLNHIASNYYGLATIKAKNILKIYHNVPFGVNPIKPAYSSIQFLSPKPRSSEGNNFIGLPI